MKAAAAQATVSVAGNLTAAAAFTVYGMFPFITRVQELLMLNNRGTIYLGGSTVNSAAQTAWVVLTNTGK